jgi:hypothetical protein
MVGTCCCGFGAGRSNTCLSVLTDYKNLSGAIPDVYVINRMNEHVHVKLNPGLPWKNLHLTKRRLFLPEN